MLHTDWFPANSAFVSHCVSRLQIQMLRKGGICYPIKKILGWTKKKSKFDKNDNKKTQFVLFFQATTKEWLWFHFVDSQPTSQCTTGNQPKQCLRTQTTHRRIGAAIWTTDVLWHVVVLKNKLQIAKANEKLRNTCFTLLFRLLQLLLDHQSQRDKESCKLCQQVNKRPMFSYRSMLEFLALVLCCMSWEMLKWKTCSFLSFFWPEWAKQLWALTKRRHNSVLDTFDDQRNENASTVCCCSESLNHVFF